MDTKGSIVILDFGSQYTHLIANRIRRLGAYSIILSPETAAEEYKDAAGVILSGGPQSVYDDSSPNADAKLFDLGVPVLGICYGLQWMTKQLGGEVSSGKTKEYGKSPITVVSEHPTLLQDCGKEFTAWMSHGDEASVLPEGFTRIGTSSACENAAFADTDRQFYAIQFHPEVTHTEHGMDILKRFIGMCDHAEWSMENYAEIIGAEIKKEVGDRNVFMLVSGGVDSTVAFTLLNKVLGADRVQGLLVDTGLMRKNEVQMIRDAFAPLHINNLHIEDASEEFLTNLQHAYDPEEKRRIIGDTFLAVQKRVSEEMQLDADAYILGQGTIYPDTIETGGTKHADQIKTHHNRVEAIQKMIDQGLVIEPLKELYKDEVRMLGEELGLPHELVWRHPFPGPGLGVRILCAKEASPLDADLSIGYSYSILPLKSVGVQGDNRTYRHAAALFTDTIDTAIFDIATSLPNSHADINRVLVCLSHNETIDFRFTPMAITSQRADLLRNADAIVDEEMRNANLYESIWQFPVVLLPIGKEKGNQTIVLRPVASTDAMTAHVPELPRDVLDTMTKRIVELDGIDCVLLDMTSKPPGTIEWE